MFRVIIKFDDGEVFNRKYDDYNKARQCYIDYRNHVDGVKTVRLFDMDDAEDVEAYNRTAADL